jgi:hypothetical protein
MLKNLVLVMAASISLSLPAYAQGFDLSNYEPNQTTVITSPQAAQGAQMQVQAQNTALTQSAEAQQTAQQQAAVADGVFNSAGDSGDYARRSYHTGSGPSGMGGFRVDNPTTTQTPAQAPQLHMTGTMGLAPVFGYGGAMQSPGGYVANTGNQTGLQPQLSPGNVTLTVDGF